MNAKLAGPPDQNLTVSGKSIDPPNRRRAMKRYFAASTAVLLASVIVLLLAASVSADPRFHGGRVYVAYEACTGRLYRPAKITLACGDGGLWVSNIVYHTYGGKTATATVEIHTHNCLPNCAESPFHAFPGTITLIDVVRCEGILYYSRARYRFTDGAPYGEASSGTAPIEPFEEDETMIHCSAVLG
jgi:hypothetical protein